MVDSGVFCLSSVIITPEAGTVDASFAHDAVLSSQESKVEGENPISGLDAEESGQIVDIMESRIGGEDVSFIPFFMSLFWFFGAELTYETFICHLALIYVFFLVFCLSSAVITPEEVTIDASYVKDANLPPQESTACDEGGAAADIDTMESKAGGEDASFDP